MRKNLIKKVLGVLVALLVCGPVFAGNVLDKTGSLFLTFCKFKDTEKNMPATLSVFSEEEKIEAKQVRLTDVAGVKGVLTYGAVASRYELKTEKPGKGKYTKTTLTLEFGKFPANTFIKEFGIKIPYIATASEKETKVTCGGEKRNDWWYLDQSKFDASFPEWLVSDKKARWPIWGIGGVYQYSPLQYKVWKTNRLDTFPLNTDQGALAPGWLDILAGEEGELVWLENMKEAPKALTFNYIEKTVNILFHPAYALPLEAPAGKKVSFSIYFYEHDSELDLDELPKDLSGFIAEYMK